MNEQNNSEDTPEYDDDPLVNFEPSSIATAGGEIYAVFEDDDGDYNALPVILFTAGPFKTERGDTGSMVVGMVSMSGGLEVAEQMEEMIFIGYWKKDLQKMTEFLEDHGIDVPDGEDEEEEG